MIPIIGISLAFKKNNIKLILRILNFITNQQNSSLQNPKNMAMIVYKKISHT